MRESDGHKTVKVRYGALYNASMAVVSVVMIGAAVVYFAFGPADAPTPSLNDSRFVMFSVLALAMAYYVYMGMSRLLNRQPQLVIDHDGIMLGFGRNRRFAWSDIQWVRLRRLALRPQLQVGIAPEVFVAADLRLSLLNLDDNLRPVRGMPTAVLVRDNGLDMPAAAMLDAVRAFRPNLVQS